MYLYLYFTINRLLSVKDKQSGMSLETFLNAVRSRKTVAKTTDILEEKLLDVIHGFDYFYFKCLKNNQLEVTDNDVITTILLLQWRFVLQRITNIKIENLSILEYQDLFINLHVHYKWLFKYSVEELSKVLCVKLDPILAKMFDDINSSSLQNFSVLHKICKRYQKSLNKPPPLTDEVQIATYKEYQKVINKINFQNLKVEVHHALINVKAEMDYHFLTTPNDLIYLQSLPELAIQDTNSFDLILIQDYLARLAVLHLKSCFELKNEFLLRSTLTVPCNIIATLTKFNSSKDERLLHELKVDIYNYLINSISIGSDSSYNLNNDQPILSCIISSLLISDVSDQNNILKICSLGNYRGVLKQHSSLNKLLWRNLQQISDKEYMFLECEKKSIYAAYCEFITQLSRTLDVELNSSGGIENCLKKIKLMYEVYTDPKNTNDMKIFIYLLSQLVIDVDKLNLQTDICEKLNTISNIYILLNYLKIMLNSKLSSLDPLAKMKLKKQYCNENINMLHNIKQCFLMQNEINSGLKSAIHSYVAIIESKIKILNEKMTKFDKNVAVRPDDIKYTYLYKEILHHSSMILNPDTIIELYIKFNEYFSVLNQSITDNSSINFELYEKFEQEVSLHLTSYTALIHTIKQYRYYYPDVIEPLLCNITEFVYGFKLKINLYERLLARCKYIDINKLVMDIIQFPSLNPNTELYRGEEMQSFITNSFSEEEKQQLVHKTENFRSLKCAILQIYNKCLIDGTFCKMLDKLLFKEFDALIKNFVNAWKQQQEEIEKRQREEQSLYKLKPKTEEQEFELQFKELFPSFHDKDFHDIQLHNTLLDETDIDEPQELNGYIGIIKLEDVNYVSQLHWHLLRVYTKTEWLNPVQSKNIDCDYVTPLILKAKLFKILLDKYRDCLDYTIDSKLLGFMNVIISVSQHFGDIHFNVEHKDAANKIKYNFYKDPQIDEVKASYHILEELKLKISEYLTEWPEHPNLQLIQTIIERIFNFDINSALSRFLTGFEILLSKCHEWEQNAHSKVSLAHHIQSLIQQIIAWRKMEMNMWKNSLNNAFIRMNEPIAKWWIYIYDLMLHFTEEDVITDDLIATLRTFMTQSNLAEFASRLNLLLAFHYHVTYLDYSERTEKFMNILWNTHAYFKQFLPNVEIKIKTLRTPIEKKLKDYIKIVKWKDISYWAIKETCEKTHKTLHKYIREFEEILKQPVTTCLTTMSQPASENVGIWDRPKRHVPKTYHYTLEPCNYIAKQPSVKKIQDKEDSTKVKRYFARARILCKKVLETMVYPRLLQSLDSFITDVIDRSSQLQNLEVDKTLTKDKQKSQAKSILQQKRKALADLFKLLSEMGLSFRTGIVQAHARTGANQFLIKPIDLNAALCHINYSRNDEKLLTIWDGCEIYYTKSIARLDTLEISLLNPAKELGSQNTERCKGFSLHLMNFIYQQKIQLIETSRLLYYLRYYLATFTTYCDNENFITIEIYGTLKHLFKTIVTSMDQYSILLQTCPDEFNFGNESDSNAVLQPDNPDFIKYKCDEVWKKCCSYVNDVRITTCKLLNTLEKDRNNLPSASFENCDIQFIPFTDGMQSIFAELDVISLRLCDFKAVFGEIPLMETISNLLKEIDLVQIILRNSLTQPVISRNTIRFNSTVQKLTQKILISTQNIYKKYKDNISEIKEDDISPDHLKVLIIENINKDIETLEMPSILNLVQNVAKQLFSNTCDDFKDILRQVLPLMDQIILLYQYFITQQVLAYRATCKMGSILFNIFVDLATKGFCIPPELNEELNSEGQGEQSGGLGLGEGEGEKDVSDRIESEDQLEDAQLADDHKKESDDKDHEEEEKGIEMSEDFEGKLQDIQKGDDEQPNSDNDGDDADEQMGETDKGAETLDQEIWGSDDEHSAESGDEQENEEKGNKGEKIGENELGARENETTSQQEQEDTSDGLEKKKEINEMEDPEYDDQQVDPYHGNQPEYPEPEPMDLPEDIALNDDLPDEGGEDEANPFDIDTMKEQMPPAVEQEKEENESTVEQKDNPDDLSNSEDELELPQQTENNIEDQVEDPDEKDTNENIADDNKVSEDINTTEIEQSALDHTQTNETKVEPMDLDDVEASDNVHTNPSENQKATKPNEDIGQEEKPDKSGTGQSRMEDSTTGHQGNTTQQDVSSMKQEIEQKEETQHKPGESDSKRSLGDTSENLKKKLKTIDTQQNQKEIDEAEPDDKNSDLEHEAEMYQHIPNAQNSNEQILDTATDEQAKQQREIPKKENEEGEEATESSNQIPESDEEDLEVNEATKQKAEKLDSNTKDKTHKRQHLEGDVMDKIEAMDVEGEIIETVTVMRGDETTHHTQYSALKDTSTPNLTIQEINDLRAEVARQLSVWTESPTTKEAEQAWEKITSVTSSLAQGLSEQLRLVLEPTQASRLKGDYRTGRRINMRKIIPYIASQFRKDKIWLRRTKPSKREYQIALAIDDSSSMNDNQSKELAFESVALISKALTLLESGQLSVLSFGETTEVLHKLTEPFTQKCGAKLLQQFKFAQTKTCVGKLVNFANDMLSSAPSRTNALLAKLLIIVGDGRGIFFEGETFVRQAIRQARLSNIFMVFLIIDSPENKDSILDIRNAVFKDKVTFTSYMDSFPFPFYIILRDINSLPHVLSDALKQWFELVSNSDM